MLNELCSVCGFHRGDDPCAGCLRAELAETKSALAREREKNAATEAHLADRLAAAERRVEELEQTVEIQMAACDRWIVRTSEANARAQAARTEALSDALNILRTHGLYNSAAYRALAGLSKPAPEKGTK